MNEKGWEKSGRKLFASSVIVYDYSTCMQCRRTHCESVSLTEGLRSVHWGCCPSGLFETWP